MRTFSLVRSVGLFFLGTCIAAGSLILEGCTTAPVTEIGFYLDTTVRITVYDGGREDVQAAMEAVRRYDSLFSPTQEGRDVARLNAAGGEAVTVNPETAVLISKALAVSELSNGAYDPTIAPVVQLWDFRSGTAVLPEPEALAQAKTLVDYHQVQVEEDASIVRLEEGASLDLGGIAKGYIADQVRALLLDRGVTSALIDLGGNIYAVGDKEGQDWTIGVRDPKAALYDDEANALAARLPVRNSSVVTSDRKSVV